MISRNDVLSQAVEQCLKELYSYVQPKISWEEFEKENKIYSEKYRILENYRHAFHNREKNPEMWMQYDASFKDWKDKPINECIGPKPYEFYYLPKDIMKDICDSYVYAYDIDSQQKLLDTISTLKNYCKEPIVDKYIDDWTDETGHHPGYRSYDYPDNLVKEVTKILTKYDDSMDSEQGEEIVNKFFEFLDMAGNFYNWNRNLNTFNMNVYLGPSPNSNKEAVIKNWKEYKNKDIKIDEEQIKKDYYGEELD